MADLLLGVTQITFSNPNAFLVLLSLGTPSLGSGVANLRVG